MSKAKVTLVTDSPALASIVQAGGHPSCVHPREEPSAESRADPTESFKTINVKRVGRSDFDTFREELVHVSRAWWKTRLILAAEQIQTPRLTACVALIIFISVQFVIINFLIDNYFTFKSKNMSLLFSLASCED